MLSQVLMEIPVGISNRHVHLSQEHLEVLFGKGYQLTLLRETKHQGQFVAQETVTVVGQKGILEHVRVMGPTRMKTQVEMSLTDCHRLGITAPVRDSGQIEGTPGCALVGPMGVVSLSHGVILAERHIHMDPTDAARAGLKDNDRVVVTAGNVRELCFHHVLVRVSPIFGLEMHLDTDEANAAMLNNGDMVQLVEKEPSDLSMAS